VRIIGVIRFSIKRTFLVRSSLQLSPENSLMEGDAPPSSLLVVPHTDGDSESFFLPDLHLRPIKKVSQRWRRVLVSDPTASLREFFIPSSRECFQAQAFLVLLIPCCARFSNYFISFFFPMALPVAFRINAFHELLPPCPDRPPVRAVIISLSFVHD